MITIFNRKELCITYSMKEQAGMRAELSKNGIEYQIKAVNRMSPSPFSSGSRATQITGSYGQNMDLNYEYIFYVRRTDYDNAKSIIG